MDKLVVTSTEVAAVPASVPAPIAAPVLPPALSWTARLLLVPLIFVLPVLSLAAVVIWFAARGREPRVFQAWMQYCYWLLAISGLGTSLFFGLAISLFTSRPAPVAEAPFALPTLRELPKGPAPEQLTPRELARRIEPAVFIVSPESKWGKPSRQTLGLSGFGTGVLVYSGEKEFLFATSRHVLDGEKWERAKPYQGEALLWDRGGSYSRAQIAGRHKSLDLMLLRMPHGPEAAPFVQPVLPFAEVEPGERVMVFGHPEGLFFSLSDGLVSRKEAPGRIQITAPVSPGASGGPVYDLHGRLLGIVSGMINKRHNPHSENLNFAVRADAFLQPEQWEMDAKALPLLNEFITASAGSTNSASSPATPAPKRAPSATPAPDLTF